MIGRAERAPQADLVGAKHDRDAMPLEQRIGNEYSADRLRTAMTALRKRSAAAQVAWHVRNAELLAALYLTYTAAPCRIMPSTNQGVSTVMRRAIAFLLACAFAAGAAWAQDLSGKWTATAVSNNVAVTLDLKVAGNVVTGAILNPQSGPAEIKEGKIEGNQISFHVLRTANNATNKIFWQGTIDGEEIRFTRSVEGATGPAMGIIAKRAQ